jgi:hypothetical protein
MVERMATVTWTLLLFLSIGCSKESLLRSSLEEAEERRDTFELTLKILDEHPEYVDELVAQAQSHPPTFDRLVVRGAAALEDPAIARRVAGTLATQPQGLEAGSRAILQRSRSSPELRRALAAAIIAEPDAAAQIVAENPAIMQQMLMRRLPGAAP